MVVGVIYPELLQVYIFDGFNYWFHKANDHDVQNGVINKIPDSFAHLFLQLNIHFDALVILSPPKPFIFALKTVVEKYAKHVSIHPLVAGILTEFINKHFNDDMAVTIKKIFGVIIDGDGFDFYKFTLVNSNEFGLIKADYHTSGSQLTFENTSTMPEYILIANIVKLRRSSPFPVNANVPIRNQPIKNFLMVALRGGIRIALSKSGQIFGYKIIDFCEKMIVSIGDRISTVSRWGAPYNRSFKNEHHMSKGSVKVYTATNIYPILDDLGSVIALKRKSDTLFNETWNAECIVTLLTSVDPFGIVQFEVKVPPLVKAMQLNTLNSPSEETETVNLTYRDQVLGNVFLSNKMIYILSDDEIQYVEHQTVKDFQTGIPLTPEIITNFYTELFNDIPVKDLKTFVFGHNGAYPAPLVAIAIETARKVLDNQVAIYVISPQTAMFFQNIRTMPCDPNSTKFFSITMFIMNNMFSAIYSQHNTTNRSHENLDGWQVDFKKPAELPSHIISALHDDPVLTYQCITAHVNDLVYYKKYYFNLGIKCKQLSPFWFEQNIIHLAVHLNMADKYMLIDRNPMVLIKFNRSRGVIFCNDKNVNNSFEKRIAIPKGTHKFKVYQNVSNDPEKEFVLFRTEDIPSDLKSILIKLNFYGWNNMPTVITVPKLTEVYTSSKVD